MYWAFRVPSRVDIPADSSQGWLTSRLKMHMDDLQLQSGLKDGISAYCIYNTSLIKTMPQLSSLIMNLKAWINY